MLVKTTRGVEAVIIRKEVHAFILTIPTYQIPAGWPRRTQANREGRKIYNEMENNCKKLDKSKNTAFCAILPVWRTTPTVVLQKEAATLPIHHILDYLCKLAILCLHKLEVQYSFRI